MLLPEPAAEIRCFPLAGEFSRKASSLTFSKDPLAGDWLPPVKLEELWRDKSLIWKKARKSIAECSVTSARTKKILRGNRPHQKWFLGRFRRKIGRRWLYLCCGWDDHPFYPPKSVLFRQVSVCCLKGKFVSWADKSWKAASSTYWLTMPTSLSASFLWCRDSIDFLLQKHAHVHVNTSKSICFWLFYRMSERRYSAAPTSPAFCLF